ncbi:MAG: hypothetical protein ACO2Z9_04555 [Crocinitomicaceae bacterium]
MRFIWTLFLFLLPSAIFAQDLEVNWGELERKQGSLIRILPSENDEFYALRWTGGSLLGHYKVSRHVGKEMVASGKLLLYAENSIATYEGVRVIGDKLIVFLSDKKDGEKILFMQVYNKEIKPEGDAVRLGAFSLERGGNKGWFDVKVSSNKEFVGVVWQIPGRKDTNDKYGFKVYTKDLELINEGEYPLPFDPELCTIHNHYISNTGDYFLALSELEITEERVVRRDKKAFKALHIYHIAEDGLQDLVINVADKRIVAMALTSDTSNIFTITGVYGEKEEPGVKGVFYRKIDLMTAEEIGGGMKDFERSFITQNWSQRELSKASRREARGRGEPQLYDYQMREANILDDGTIVGTMEQYFVRVRSTYDSRTGQSTNIYYYYYNDIIAYKINANGEFDWFKKIPKYQVSMNDGGPFSSFESVVSNGYIHFIFNDNVRNYSDDGDFLGSDRLQVANYSKRKNVVALVSMDLDSGEQERRNFFDRSTVDVLAIPKKFEVDHRENRMIIYGIWGRTKEKFGFVKI